MAEECGRIDIAPIIARLNQIDQRLGRLENKTAQIENATMAIKGLVQTLPSLIQNSVQGATQIILQAIRSIENLIQQVLRIFQEGIRTVQVLIQSLFSFLSSLFGRNDDTDRIIAAINALRSDIDRGLEGIRQLVRQTTDRITTAIYNARNDILGGVESLQNTLRDIIRFLNGRLNDIFNAVDSIQQKIDDIIRFLNGRLNDIFNAVDSLRQDIYDIPVKINQMISKLQQSIDNLRQDLIANIQTIARLINGLNIPSLDQIRGAIAAELAKLKFPTIDEIKAAIRAELSKLKFPTIDEIRGAIAAELAKLKFPTIDQIRGVVNEGIGKVLSAIRNFKQQNNDLSAALNKIMAGISQLSQLLKPDIKFTLSSLDETCQPKIYASGGQGIQGISNQLAAIASMISDGKRHACTVNDTSEVDPPEDDQTLTRIYRILGGDAWFENGGAHPSRQLHAEANMGTWMRAAYANEAPKSTSVSNLLDYLSASQAVIYRRLGLDRYPARVPISLTGDSQEQTTLHDAASWQEWEIKQLDSLAGAYPIKIKYVDPNGTEKNLSIANQAEMLSEMFGILLSLNADTDFLQDLGFKTIVETIAARMAATQAYDFAKANSEYLGYQYTEDEREVEIPITPTAKNLKGFMEQSMQKVKRFRAVDQPNLVEVSNQLLAGVGIIKGAFFRPLSLFNDSLPGDGIKEGQEADRSQGDLNWQRFIQQFEAPPPGRFPASAPKPDLDNLGNYGGEDGGQ
jgi:phage-related protein